MSTEEMTVSRRRALQLLAVGPGTLLLAACGAAGQPAAPTCKRHRGPGCPGATGKRQRYDDSRQRRGSRCYARGKSRMLKNASSCTRG
jgi:hypothetical protein